MKINQIIETKESLTTYLALKNKAPINFKNKLDTAINKYQQKELTDLEFQQELDNIADGIESVIFSQSFDLIDNDPEIDLLIDDYNTVDEQITKAREEK